MKGKRSPIGFITASHPEDRSEPQAEAPQAEMQDVGRQKPEQIKWPEHPVLAELRRLRVRVRIGPDGHLVVGLPSVTTVREMQTIQTFVREHTDEIKAALTRPHQ